jgi:hypothetical protein
MRRREIMIFIEVKYNAANLDNKRTPRPQTFNKEWKIWQLQESNPDLDP